MALIEIDGLLIKNSDFTRQTVREPDGTCFKLGPNKLSTPIILVAKQPYPIVPNLLSTATGVEYERGHYSSPHEDRTNFQAVLDDIQYTFPRFPVASFVGVSIFLFSTIDFLKNDSNSNMWLVYSCYTIRWLVFIDF